MLFSPNDIRRVGEILAFASVGHGFTWHALDFNDFEARSALLNALSIDRSGPADHDSAWRRRRSFDQHEAAFVPRCT